VKLPVFPVFTVTFSMVWEAVVDADVVHVVLVLIANVEFSVPVILIVAVVVVVVDDV